LHAVHHVIVSKYLWVNSK